MSVEELLALGRELAAPPKTSEGENNFIRHARRLLRVRDREGQLAPLDANEAQKNFELARGQKNIVLKARQMGMTTWISGRFFLRTITQRGVLTVQVAQTREAAEAIFRIVQRFWEYLPEEYRQGPLRRSRKNMGQMVFPELDSEFRIVTAGDKNAGRGMTIQNLHCSEVSRWPGDARETLAGLRAALSPTGEMVLESTPNGAMGCFYDEWTQAEVSGLKRHFFPWWLESAYVSAPATEFNDEELELMRRHNLSACQIGYRRTLEADYRNLHAQEFAEDPERCFRATGECCFEIEAIEQRMQELGEPVSRNPRNTLLTWMPPVPDRQYLVAVDTAGGGAEGDFSVAQVIDLATGIQCAELQQRLRPIPFTQEAAKLARQYNNAMIVVERNNHGTGILALLIRMENYTNLYEQNGNEGWLTNAASKPAAIALLGALLVQSPGMFLSKRLLAECRTFVTRANGSTGAIAGAHDDCVMAMAIAQQVRTELMLKKRSS
ncbi:terminase [Granulicella arctica]|uniref:Terminase n=1 Tax=Granulicella arctica TaxID=940613 RepID=A0A7Y9PF71_9BACT|nr:terminase [Granulicella arctica]NYF78569.1 hypothetical protein [Granulicella arctica]